MAFLRKLPRLYDRYFQSRLSSDMAHRCHSVHAIRATPQLGGTILRTAFELAATTAGIAWIDPPSAPLAVLVAVVSLALPLSAHPWLSAREMKVRTHAGALSRFYLDALLGLVPIRSHGAERTVREEHESLLSEWARESLRLLRAVTTAEAATAAAGFALTAWLLWRHLGSTHGQSGAVLLVAYWALQLPALGQELALVIRQYPAQRNVAARLLEPLGAREAPEPDPVVQRRSGDPERGVAISMRKASVLVSGHTVLREIDLEIAPGEHVAVVGPSGAGKSTLVGLLLGWHRPAEGTVEVDGAPLDATRLDWLRCRTAWVDPAVQLWNRSLLANLLYGAPPSDIHSVGPALDAAELGGVLERLPDGLATRLGEGGALVSGGEGQRVRLGRAMVRQGPSLVLLDEPLRGIDRGQRRHLLRSARARFRGATLLCVTHDIGETRAFPRVVVIEAGRIVQDGDPEALAREPGSRYLTMLEAEQAVRRAFYEGPTGPRGPRSWRRLRLEGGVLHEGGDPETPRTMRETIDA